MKYVQCNERCVDGKINSVSLNPAGPIYYTCVGNSFTEPIVTVDITKGTIKCDDGVWAQPQCSANWGKDPNKPDVPVNYTWTEAYTPPIPTVFTQPGITTYLGKISATPDSPFCGVIYEPFGPITIKALKFTFRNPVVYVCWSTGNSYEASGNLTFDSYDTSAMSWSLVTLEGDSSAWIDPNTGKLYYGTIGGGKYIITVRSTEADCDAEMTLNVIKVDIDGAEVFKCTYNATTENLYLKSDSYSPLGYVWTVDPPQGLNYSVAGDVFSYDPGVLTTPGTYIVKAASFYLYDCLDVATINIVETDNIDAAAPGSGASPNPPPFKGHTPWPFDETLSPDPGKHMIVFYKDVIDSSFNVQDFDVTLKANVLPTSITAGQLNEVWSKISGPASGGFDRTDTFEVKFQNPKKGGVYRFNFDLGVCCCPKSEVNVVLPLAGAEVDSIVSADIGRANTFATTVNAKYKYWQINSKSKLINWFWLNGAGDYLGRPDSTSSPTVRAYNEVTSDGYYAVSTWKGKPIRVAKISNFMIAYAARKIDVHRALAWAMQFGGTPNDTSATKSWNAGWALGGGAGSYDSTVLNLVADIWDDDADPTQKNMKLWPNLAACDNFAPPGGNNYSLQFTSPGFLYMTNP